MNTLKSNSNQAIRADGQLPHKRLSNSSLFLVVLAILTVIAVSVASFLYFKPSKPKAVAKVKIGVMMAFSGGSSSMGYGVMKGVSLAKKQLNAEDLEFVQVDSKCDPKSAAEAVKKLIEQKVVAIIGEGCSSATIAALPAVNNAKVPLISPTASAQALSIADDYFFRAIPADNFQAKFLAKAIFDRGIKRVAVFYTNEPYGSGMNNNFRDAFKNLGGEVVATATSDPDMIDLKGSMESLKTAKPQALFISPNSAVSATAALKIAYEIGLKVSVFGADMMYDQTIIDSAPEASSNLTITSFPTGTKDFKKALLNEYQKTEQLYGAAQAYDVVTALKMVIDGGAKTGEQIKAGLMTLNFTGVSAQIKFDKNGEISDPAYKYELYQVKDGTFVLVE